MKVFCICGLYGFAQLAAGVRAKLLCLSFNEIRRKRGVSRVAAVAAGLKKERVGNKISQCPNVSRGVCRLIGRRFSAHKCLKQRGAKLPRAAIYLIRILFQFKGRNELVLP